MRRVYDILLHRHKQSRRRLIDRRVLSGAAAVHFTSEEEQEEGAMVASALRPVVIPNPVDFQFDRDQFAAGWLRSRYPAIAGKQIILFLSRLHPKKGLDLLLAAFARLRARNSNVVLVLSGAADEDFVQGLHQQARHL